MNTKQKQTHAKQTKRLKELARQLRSMKIEVNRIKREIIKALECGE